MLVDKQERLDVVMRTWCEIDSRWGRKRERERQSKRKRLRARESERERERTRMWKMEPIFIFPFFAEAPLIVRSVFWVGNQNSDTATFFLSTWKNCNKTLLCCKNGSCFGNSGFKVKQKITPTIVIHFIKFFFTRTLPQTRFAEPWIVLDGFNLKYNSHT